MKKLALKMTLVCLAMIALLCPMVAGQSEADDLFNRLEGNWKGDGKALGAVAYLQIKWERVLSKKFVKLSLRNERKVDKGPQVFEGHAYYPVGGKGTLEARWFDSRGLSFPIKAHIERDALIAYWGSPDTEEGKSVYRLLDSAKLEVVDSVKQKDGTWREFGRFVVLRQ